MTEPKKAGSLLIFRPITPESVSANDYFDYKILFLTRNKTMTFGNTIVFPGGKIEPNDLKFLSSNPKYISSAYQTASPFHNLFKLSALRETYEETGLFFTANPQNDDNVQKTIQSLKGDKPHPDYFDLANQLGINFNEDVIEFLRFVTPHIFKHRFDTQFFILKADPSKTFNVLSSIADKNDLRNLDKLHINLGESSGFFWLNPYQALSKHFMSEVELPPPQVMMMNILLSFKKYSELEKYLHFIRNDAPKNQEGEFRRDFPLTFPLAPYFSLTKEEKYVKRSLEVIFLLPYDAEFPFEKAIGHETSETFKKELTQYYQSMGKKKENARCRLYSNNAKEKLKESDADSNFEDHTPMRFLKGTLEFKALMNKPSL